MNIKKVLIAVVFSIAIILPWMAFTGDLRDGRADPWWGNAWDACTWHEADRIQFGYECNE